MTFIRQFYKDPLLSLLSDEELVLRFCQTGDMQLIGELYRRYSHLVLGVCLKYLRDEDDACDATMQIFEKMMADLKRNRPENLKPWLYTVAKNHCLMALRKNVSEQKHIGLIRNDSSEKFVEIWDELHLNHEYDEEKRLEALAGALSSLVPEQSTCVRMIYLENKSYKEIAQITGMDINQVKSHIQNGKRNLKILLEKTR
jgi:RNA polymerase sigma factor, sigma-70 family